VRVVSGKPRRLRELDREIEALREKLYRLVSSNPSQLRTPLVYELSMKLDELIARLQADMVGAADVTSGVSEAEAKKINGWVGGCQHGAYRSKGFDFCDPFLRRT